MSAVDHIFKKAVDLHANGHLQQAEKLYKKILKSYPNHPDILHLLGLVSFQNGKYQSAVKLFEQAISMYSGNPDFYNDCGEAYRALREYDAAARCYEKALALNPGFAEAHNNMGNLLSDVGQIDEALDHYRQAIELKNDYFAAHYNMANALRDAGKIDFAIESYHHALQLNPVVAEVHNNLGTAYRDNNQPDLAEYHYKCALQVKPAYVPALLNLGLLHLEQGRPDLAITDYQNALSVAPDNIEAHSNLANACLSLGRLQPAAEHFRKVLSLQPEDADCHNRLGIVLAEQGHTEEAIAHYRQALDRKPDFAEAHNNLATAYQDMGNFEQAINHFQLALSQKTDYVEVYRHLAILGDDTFSNELMVRVEALLGNPDISEENAMHLYFALGDINNRKKNYDDAFQYYEKANRIKRKSLSFDIDAHRDYISRTIRVFDKDYFSNPLSTASTSELPVFIIGMPRSGTTLVEQILASHPEVCGAGELDNFLHIEQTIASRLGGGSSYPECMNYLDNETAMVISSEYLDYLQSYSREARYITDKLPGNFLRIGLIKTLFPEVRVIHCERNAMDTCLSVYCNYFTGGHDYAYDLADLGNYYREYQRLMSHWNNLFNKRIFTIHYEELVMNQESITRQLLDY
ncbi:MAG TPA: tetratricopeptide repeat protein, partial [Gammaproteobacteria bacterium]|nr:tetratricopeptide repeat protein [Gammaproteobacteria bacterium]